METDTKKPVSPRPPQGGEEPLDPASCSPAPKNEIVSASLYVSINVECPHCESYIDLLKSEDTDGVEHNDEAALMGQAFPDSPSWSESHRGFECRDVTCTECQKTFDVEILEW